MGADKSVQYELISVAHIVGSRIALIENDMFLGGLYDTAIH